MRKKILALAIITGNSSISYANSLSEDQSLQLEEVVVTAQRRTESLQDVGASVNAVSGDALQDFNAFSFDEVAKLTAGITLDNSNPRQQSISMRGVSFDPEGTSAAAVDAYWNKVSVRPDVIFSQMYDVDHLEVLRGPQGTLQGKTSPGGAILLETRKPNMEEVDGYLQSSLTESGETNTQLGVSVPIIPGELSMRVAGLFNEDEGLGYKNTTTGKDDVGRDKAGRITLAWMPNDTFSADLTMEYSEQFMRLSEDVYHEDDPGGKYDGISLSFGDNSYVKRNKLAALSMDWQISDNLMLSSITGFQDTYSRDIRDMDYGNDTPDKAQFQRAEIETEQFSQELRLSSVDPGFWDWTVGVYYEDRDQSTNLLRSLMPGIAEDPALGNIWMSAEGIPSDREEWGIFFHNTFNFTDSTRLQAGLRQQQVRTYYRFDGTVRAGLGCLPIVGCNIGDIEDIEAIKNNDRDKTDAFTGTLKLMHDLDDDVMIYASYDRSFRAGGVGIEPNLTQHEADIMYDDETSDSFEVGVKSMLFDRRLQLNASMYYQLYDNYISRAGQISIYKGEDIPGIGDIAIAEGVMFNGDAIVQGAEVDFNAILTENWTLGGALSYVDAKYDDADVPCHAEGANPDPGGSQVVTCISNGRVSGEPNKSASLNTEYIVPFDQVDVFGRALYKFTGKRRNPFLEDSQLGGFGVTDLYLGVRDKNQQWEGSIWAKNAFDKQAQNSIKAPHRVNDIGGALSGYRQVDIIQERVVGITGRYFF